MLLQSYTDTLRNDEEREINHHGKSVTIDDDNQPAGRKIQVLEKYLQLMIALQMFRSNPLKLPFALLMRKRNSKHKGYSIKRLK